MRSSNGEGGPRLVASVGQLVKEHQLPDISVGGDLAGEVSLQNV